jgi:Zn-dependent protease
MTLQHIDIFFKLIAFLFAISIHESAHAWMANLRGDPTARMLGRITLNPIKHIDPVGTLLFPLLGLYYSGSVFGWAKPTPVDPRNFKNPILDDILTSVVGPVSNFVVAVVAVIILTCVKLVSPAGREIVFGIPQGFIGADADSFLVPVCLLFYELMYINVILGVFNLIPVPPLDGSHVVRHFLPPQILKLYDGVGMFGLFILVFWGSRFLSMLIAPPIAFFNYILLRF